MPSLDVLLLSTIEESPRTVWRLRSIDPNEGDVDPQVYDITGVRKAFEGERIDSNWPVLGCEAPEIGDLAVAPSEVVEIPHSLVWSLVPASGIPRYEGGGSLSPLARTQLT